jgi:SAM-dependent methyltransferase
VKRNEPKTWDALWDKSEKNALMAMLEEERTNIRYKRIYTVLLQTFSDLKGLKTIELGGGTGTYSALLALNGCHATVVDYSPKALDASRALFKTYNITGEQLELNALSLPHEMQGQFDISMSFGTAEHFKGAEREGFIKAHFDVLRKGGLAIISVPNAWCVPYRLWKYKLEKQDRWNWGEEYPFTRRELRKICSLFSPHETIYLGDSFLDSFNYINWLTPRRLFTRLFGIPGMKSRIQENAIPRKSHGGTPLDAYLSYALVALIKKG